MSKQYRKIISGCPVCGKLYCKLYGYAKSDKKWINSQTRNELKKDAKKQVKEGVEYELSNRHKF